MIGKIFGSVKRAINFNSFQKRLFCVVFAACLISGFLTNDMYRIHYRARITVGKMHDTVDDQFKSLTYLRTFDDRPLVDARGVPTTERIVAITDQVLREADFQAFLEIAREKTKASERNLNSFIRNFSFLFSEMRDVFISSMTHDPETQHEIMRLFLDMFIERVQTEMEEEYSRTRQSLKDRVWAHLRYLEAQSSVLVNRGCLKRYSQQLYEDCARLHAKSAALQVVLDDIEKFKMPKDLVKKHFNSFPIKQTPLNISHWKIIIVSALASFLFSALFSPVSRLLNETR